MIFEEIKPGRTRLGKKIRVYKTHLKAKRFVYLLAGIQGDKVEGIYILENLFQWLKDHHQIKDIPLIIVPVINPDGYAASTSSNAGNKQICPDLSQYILDNKHLLQPESKLLLSLFKKYPPGKVIHFNSGKPAHIYFSEGGKKFASFISKFNFYDLKRLEEKNLLFGLSEYLGKNYSCPLIDVRYPRVVENLGLKDIWSHNKKSLIELLSSEILEKLI